MKFKPHRQSKQASWFPSRKMENLAGCGSAPPSNWFRQALKTPCNVREDAHIVCQTSNGEVLVIRHSGQRECRLTSNKKFRAQRHGKAALPWEERARPSRQGGTNMTHKLFASIMVLLSLGVSGIPTASGQLVSGSITGNVYDPSGAPVPNAKVKA